MKKPSAKITAKTQGKKYFLTLGPLFFHWTAERRRDFYFRIADEADIDVVYLGEAICRKREPLFAKYQEKVIERLLKAKKQIVLSSLAMVTDPRDIESVKQKTKSGFLVEGNDISAVHLLAGKSFVVGPFINVLNEGTRDYLISIGAKRIVLASELSEKAIKVLANSNAEIEVQVFGRQPLSVSMRCYAARAYGRNKDNCRFSCGNDPDGIAVETLDGRPFLSVFGTGTMSYGYLVLLKEIKKMQKYGIKFFRISPQDIDMTKIIEIYRAILDGKKGPDSALASIRKITGFMPFTNGFFHGREGMFWKE